MGDETMTAVYTSAEMHKILDQSPIGLTSESVEIDADFAAALASELECADADCIRLSAVANATTLRQWPAALGTAGIGDMSRDDASAVDAGWMRWPEDSARFVVTASDGSRRLKIGTGDTVASQAENASGFRRCVTDFGHAGLIVTDSRNGDVVLVADASWGWAVAGT